LAGEKIGTEHANHRECFRHAKVAFDFTSEFFVIESRMSSKQIEVILKSFDAPDEVRVMEKGRFELVAPRRDNGWSGYV